MTARIIFDNPDRGANRFVFDSAIVPSDICLQFRANRWTASCIAPLLTNGWICCDEVEVEPEIRPAGGFWYDFENERLRAKAERDKLVDLELKALFIEEKLEREIALEFRKREEEENRLIELSMLTKLVSEHQEDIDRSFNDRVKLAANRAIMNGNYSAMEALERELLRGREEELFLIVATRIILDA